ncbi:MAG TPA: VOC family protein [Vicinamibacterales bacterium]|nr:VOC family protein [Vicinamibacterales bacterium]
MTQNPVTWFEIPVNDLNKAKTFYERVLGVKLDLNDMGGSQMAWFPMAQGGPGAAGTLIKSEGYTPSHSGSLVYFSVEDIEGALKKAEASGGKTLVPKMSIGEHGFIAHLEDCEGNRVALHSRT